MRIIIAAVGRLKRGPETELAERYLKRAEQTGRNLGWRSIEIVEIRESRADDAARRMLEESIALANIIPDGALTVLLDERGENLGSAGFAQKLAEWRAADRAGPGLHDRRRRWPGAEPARQGQAHIIVRRGDLAAPDRAGRCCWSSFIGRRRY